MNYTRLDRDTLAHVDERYYYGAYCRKCNHGARLSLIKLRDHLGENFPLSPIRENQTFERCGSRAVPITFLAPDHKTESLVKVFGDEPRKYLQTS